MHNAINDKWIHEKIIPVIGTEKHGGIGRRAGCCRSDASVDATEATSLPETLS